MFLNNVIEVLKDKERRWLNASILCFVGLLPFNSFSLSSFGIDFLSGRYFQLKFTKLALLLVVLCGVYAVVRNRIKIQKAYLLYGLLVLQVVANLFSVINSPDPRQSLILSLIVAQYGVLVFIILTVCFSEKILKAILTVMACSTLVLVIHSMALYVLQGWEFHTRFQPSIVGNNIAHYLAYALIMFGTGLVYLLFHEQRRIVKFALWIFSGLWLFVINLAAVKIAIASEFIFLLALLVFVPNRRKSVCGLIALLLVSLSVVPVTFWTMNSYRTLRYSMEVNNYLDSNVEEIVEEEVAEEVIIESLTEAVSPVPLIEKNFNESDLEETVAILSEIDSSAELSVEESEMPVLELLSRYSGQYRMIERWSNFFGSGGSFNVRLRSLTVGLIMGAQSPLTGVGVGQTYQFYRNASLAIEEYAADPAFYPRFPLREYFLDDTHFRIQDHQRGYGIYNIFMNAWAETGFLGFLAIVGIVLFVGFKSVRALLMSDQTITSLHFMLPLFLAVIFYHQAIYMFLHPWLWTIVSLTYVSADLLEKKCALKK